MIDGWDPDVTGGLASPELVQPLEGENPETDSVREAGHWLRVYTELLQTEEWALDDGLPDPNILKLRLQRLRALKQRQQFWLRRQAEIRLTQSR